MGIIGALGCGKGINGMEGQPGLDDNGVNMGCRLAAEQLGPVSILETPTAQSEAVCCSYPVAKCSCLYKA